MAVDKENAVKFHDRKAVDERTLDPPEHETNHAHPCPSATPVRFPYDSLATRPVSRSFGANLRYQATLQLPPIPDTDQMARSGPYAAVAEKPAAEIGRNRLG